MLKQSWDILDVSLDGSNVDKLEVLLLGCSLGSTDVKVLGYGDGIKLGYNDVKVLDNIIVNVM